MNQADVHAQLKRERSRNLRSLRELLPFLWPYRLRMGLALMALLIAAGATLAMPAAIRQVIDQGLSSEQAATINQYFLALFFLAALLAVFSALRFYLVSWLGERVVTDIRASVYQHVLKLSPTFFEVTRTGEVLSRLTTDTTLIQSVVGSSLSIAMRSTVTLIGGLVLLTITSPRLTGMILVLVPIVIGPILYYGRRLRKLSRESQDRIADSSGIAGETLNAIRIVQSFTLEGLQSRRFTHAVERSFDVALKRIRTRAWLTALAITIVFGSIVFVLWVGAHDVIAGRMSGGELGQFLLYAILVAGSTAALSDIWGELQRAAGATERLMELLEAEPDVKAPDNPQSLPEPGSGRIEFEHVYFNYPSRPNQTALNDISLSIMSGETVALVGPSGAGKSTLFQLLLRFYDPLSGVIRLDGVDIARVEPEAVRERIGIVPQETVIFADDALENIRIGKPTASDGEVRAAARAAQADEFIERQPEGWQTFLGERGLRLSGGQQQRIAIARAILKNPPILLLDEATSALDAESERLVQKALESLMHDRTTLVIAHRLATVLKADRIVVMDHGHIVAIGSHEELLRQGGLYARLAELQFSQDQTRPAAAVGES
ncbi:MAG: ABC transporter transmembrane domain-containing protein [Gammaproteobacteria bacterium]|nr:ABC transporter transmembrane domain-containing protein [Gammaproteobacteria bacterium]